jgi:hypothetical protein
MLDTPVLFIVFNRPDTTKKVFESIRSIKPRQLFIAADGPRNNNENDEIKCRQVKDIVAGIDWECSVKTLFREENLGCGRAVSGAIDWFFSQVEEGIILEDDTLPDPSFFHFCSFLLKKYRETEEVMHIGGCNFDFFNETKNTQPYFFSNIIHIWGWATWKRSWIKYDFSMTGFSDEKKDLQCSPVFLDLFQKVFAHEIDTWDYQWMYAVLRAQGKAIIPSVNVVQNIGFGQNATHTKQSPRWNKIAAKKDVTGYRNSFDPIYSKEYEKIVIKNTIVEDYSLIQKIKLLLLND